MSISEPSMCHNATRYWTESRSPLSLGLLRCAFHAFFAEEVRGFPKGILYFDGRHSTDELFELFGWHLGAYHAQTGHDPPLGPLENSGTGEMVAPIHR
jgi:hypothetical protein